MRVKKTPPLSILEYFFIIVTCVGICISAWSVLNGNIAFHTDIARDFLLLQDLVDKGDVSLIGPRAGGIQGLFHGPLWMYLHAPIYFIGHGNPVVIGWFWVLLSAVATGIIGWVGKKLFGRTEGLAAMALFSASLFDVTRGLYNPFGAVMIAPLFLYSLIKYTHTQKIRYVLWTYFFIGLLIQFQMAFGVPMLLLSLFITSYSIFRHKRYAHILFYFVILLPLSTHILFEVRNDFLQTRSIIAFLQHPKSTDLTFAQQAWEYLLAIFNGVVILKKPMMFLSAPLIWLSGLWLYQENKIKKLPARDVYSTIFFLYIGFWVVALLFRGSIQSYYSWPFVTFTYLIFGSMLKIMNKKVWMFLICSMLGWHLTLGVIDAKKLSASIYVDGSSWITSHEMAQTVYASTKEDFGYFIFSPELFGYSPRYAMDYTQKEFTHKAFPFEKKKTTYLIIIPPRENGIEKDVDWWKANEIFIATSGAEIKRVGDYIIEKHTLTEEELAIPANPNLIQGIYFR